MSKIPLFLLAVSSPLAMVASASPAPAPQKGRWVIDLLAAPDAGGLALGYYITDHLSFRPSLGFGHSSITGTFYTIGGSVRYDLGPQRRLVPYLQGQAAYVHNQGVPVDPADPSQGLDVYTHGARFGFGAGLRYRLNRRFALFSEARLTHSTTPDAFYSSFNDWGRFRLSDHDHFEIGLGLTITLNPSSPKP